MSLVCRVEQQLATGPEVVRLKNSVRGHLKFQQNHTEEEQGLSLCSSQDIRNQTHRTEVHSPSGCRGYNAPAVTQCRHAWLAPLRGNTTQLWGSVTPSSEDWVAPSPTEHHCRAGGPQASDWPEGQNLCSSWVLCLSHHKNPTTAQTVFF